MDGRVGSCLRLLVLLYLCVLPATAYSKCKGQWAIHSCFGGNGKRSDPGLALQAGGQGRGQGGLLQRLLSRPPYPELSEFPEPQEAAPYPLSPLSPLGEGDAYPTQPRHFPTSDGRRLRSMLRTLMLERQLRSNDVEEDLA